MLASFSVPVTEGEIHGVTAGPHHVDDQDHEPPLVFLHGGALDHHQWRHQLESFADDRHVVALDARGHGASSTPTSPFRHADDVAAVLADRAFGPAVLVGLSLGASTAVDVAVEHPELVAGLVVVGAGVGAGPEEFTDPWMQQVFAEWAAAQERQDPQGWLDVFVRLGFGPGRDLDAVSTDVVEHVRQMAADTLAVHVAAGAAGPIVTGDARGELADLRIPVLAVHGALDAPDHHRMAAEVARQAPRGREVTIDGAAHYPPLEQPTAFDAALRTFLDEGFVTRS